jgi:5-methylthioadenosine/S-adenosylhomocysteine deaminase
MQFYLQYTFMKKQFLVTCLVIFSFQLTAQEKVKTIDLLIKNVTIADVLEKKINENKTIGINGGKIVFIGAYSRGFAAKKTIDGSGLIALPGFVNTHTHLWQHVAKAAYPKEKLQEWVRIYGVIHYLTPEELYKVVLAASSEAILSGITTVSDYASLCFNDYGFATNYRAIYDAGLGGVIVWHNPSVFLPDNIKEKEILKYQAAFKNKFSIWMGHGPLSFHSLPQVYSGIRLGQRLNMNMTEHTMENVQEQRTLFDTLTKYYDTFKQLLKQEDKTVIEKMLSMERPSNVDAYELVQRDAIQMLKIDADLKKLTEGQKVSLSGLQGKRIISPVIMLEHLAVLQDYLAIHSVWQQPEDIALMKKYNVSVSHNPESNLYLSSGIAPFNDYLNAGINTTIGTDGAASNDGINFFSAMKEMWNDYKFDLLNTDVTKNFDEWNILQAATINGAKSLKIDDVTGSVTEGKEADIVLLSKKELGMAPYRVGKVVPLIIYSANTRNVEYVISNGNIVVKDGKLTKFDEAKLATDLSAITTAVEQRAKEGKIWNAYYKVSGKNATTYWYKYRSVRKADSINLVIENTGPDTLKVTVSSSGLTFGGGISYMADKEVNDRFPQNNPEKSFYQPVPILPKQKMQIVKNKDQWDIVIIRGSKSDTYATKAGQLLVLAEK